MSNLGTKEVAFYVNEIRDAGRDLSDWEEDFLKSMDKLVEHGWSASEKQQACLLKIYEKTTS